MTTPTGVPIIDCPTCHHRHPATRTHCTACGLATPFIRPDGACIRHPHQPTLLEES